MDSPADGMSEENKKLLAEMGEQYRDIVQMTPSQFALYTKGHAEPRSPRDSWHRYIMEAKIAELQAAAIERQTEAQNCASRAMEKLTTAYVRATWAIAALTGMLVVVMVVDTVIRLSGR